MSHQVDGRLVVVEEADRVLVARAADPTDWLCAFAKAGGFPARRWAEDMARTYNARVAVGRDGDDDLRPAMLPPREPEEPQ